LLPRSSCIVGVGESTYYRHGKSPVTEFALTCEAVLAAAKDAGLDPRDLDGFASYAADRNEGVRLGAALGVREINFSNMVWGGGGGGCAAAVGNAMAAVSAGLATYVVVYRGLAQGQFERYGASVDTGARALRWVNWRPYGLSSPVQGLALNFRRFMHLHGTSQDALAAISLTSYDHAQRNPRAVMYGRPLTREQYDSSRWIAEPFHLYDCCQENDGAAAVIVTTAERARDMSATPAYIAAAAQGSQPRPFGADGEDRYFGSSNFGSVAKRLFAQAGMSPSDIDVAQVYENFTGGVVMALVDGGFCAADEVNEFITEKNLSWSGGKLPLNTSGGNLAEAYIHGLELVNEAVRQIRGESTCQVPDVRTSMVIGGPRDAPISSLILTREA
jgi:acetyl-CoA acetyltransferase